MASYSDARDDNEILLKPQAFFEVGNCASKNVPRLQAAFRYYIGRSDLRDSPSVGSWSDLLHPAHSNFYHASSLSTAEKMGN